MWKITYLCRVMSPQFPYCYMCWMCANVWLTLKRQKKNATQSLSISAVRTQYNFSVDMRSVTWSDDRSPDSIKRSQKYWVASDKLHVPHQKLRITITDDNYQLEKFKFCEFVSICTDIFCCDLKKLCWLICSKSATKSRLDTSKIQKFSKRGGGTPPLIPHPQAGGPPTDRLEVDPHLASRNLGAMG